MDCVTKLNRKKIFTELKSNAMKFVVIAITESRGTNEMRAIPIL